MAGVTSAHPQASGGARRTTSASASPTQGNAHSAEPPTPKHARENPKIPHPRNRKNKERKDRQKIATHPRNHCPLEDRPCVVVLVVLRWSFRRAFVRSVAILVLRWSRVVVTEEEVAMEVLEGRSSKGAGRGGLGSVKRGC
jgi:hypothetical protein